MQLVVLVLLLLEVLLKDLLVLLSGKILFGLAFKVVLNIFEFVLFDFEVFVQVQNLVVQIFNFRGLGKLFKLEIFLLFRVDADLAFHL